MYLAGAKLSCHSKKLDWVHVGINSVMKDVKGGVLWTILEEGQEGDAKMGVQFLIQNMIW